MLCRGSLGVLSLEWVLVVVAAAAPVLPSCLGTPEGIAEGEDEDSP